MTYEYDYDSDCAYVRFSAAEHHHSVEIDVTRFVDYAEDGSVIGIELLYVSGGVDVTDLPCAEAVAAELQAHGVKIMHT